MIYLQSRVTLIVRQLLGAWWYRLSLLAPFLGSGVSIRFVYCVSATVFHKCVFFSSFLWIFPALLYHSFWFNIIQRLDFWLKEGSLSVLWRHKCLQLWSRDWWVFPHVSPWHWCFLTFFDFFCAGVIAFLAAAVLLAGEYFFPQMSSVKTRRHYVIGDLAFSGECRCILVTKTCIFFHLCTSLFLWNRILGFPLWSGFHLPR